MLSSCGMDRYLRDRVERELYWLESPIRTDYFIEDTSTGTDAAVYVYT